MTDERRELALPDRRQTTYIQLQEHLDARLDTIELHIHKWIKRGLIAFAVIGLFVTIAVLGLGIALHEIQEQRYDNCVDQNTRHNNTVARFKDIAADAKKQHPEQAQAIDANINANLKIIDAIAPHQNCGTIRRINIVP